MSQPMLLPPGVPAPWFEANCTTNPRFHLDTAAGRYMVLCFFGSAAQPVARHILDGFLVGRKAFDDEHVCFFGISTDPDDQRYGRVHELLPGIRFFWDFDRAVSRLYGAERDDGTYLAHTLILDERLRVLALLPFDADPENHAEQVLNYVKQLPSLGPPRLAAPQAPVLIVPRLFERELCLALIDYYERHGGEESGFMREVEGRTVAVMDSGFKRRRDQLIADEGLRQACMARLAHRLVPEIQKAYQFQATRIERYIVACYDASSGGYFRPHRDNTTKGTAHRRFAVSLNLNTGDYEGGMLRFPEFGPALYAPPAGGAVVFSCSLLHEATPVVRGKRYAFLPFLYDDAAARIRDENRIYLGSPTSAAS